LIPATLALGAVWWAAGTASVGDAVARLDRRIPELMRTAEVPGLSVALIRGSKVAWVKGYGLRDAASKQPVEVTTVFEAASLSKPVFAYALLKLVEQGKLDLDAPLSQYLAAPYIQDDRLKLVTVRRVLSHTTGFPNWRPGGKPLTIHFTPGERFSYSGEGFVYLQTVVEHVTGQPLQEFMQKTVFEPLGMKYSSYVWQPRYDAQAALGHSLAGQPVPKGKPSKANAAASLHTTAGDYGRFMMALMSGTGLTRATVREMLSPQSRIDENCRSQCLEPKEPPRLSAALSWGLGVGLQKTRDGQGFWHWGDNGTFKCYMLAFPKRRTGLVVFTNSTNGLAIVPEIVALALGGPQPALDWLKYPGYNSPVARLSQAIRRDGGQSALQAYRARRDADPKTESVSESEMNSLGYAFLQMKKIPEALEIFKLNVEAFPSSFNVYDSLGEACMAAGDKARAIENYERSLELNPGNEGAREALKKLRGQ
jgi:CubicO group peptidase (beta-lactamase class C family)